MEPVEILSSLAGGPTDRFATKGLTVDGETEFEQAKSRAYYDAAVSQIAREWGPPKFAGSGCEARLQPFLRPLRAVPKTAVHVSGWLKDDAVFAIVLNGPYAVEGAACNSWPNDAKFSISCVAAGRRGEPSNPIKWLEKNSWNSGVLETHDAATDPDWNEMSDAYQAQVSAASKRLGSPDLDGSKEAAQRAAVLPKALGYFLSHSKRLSAWMRDGVVRAIMVLANQTDGRRWLLAMRFEDDAVAQLLKVSKSANGGFVPPPDRYQFGEAQDPEWAKLWFDAAVAELSASWGPPPFSELGPFPDVNLPETLRPLTLHCVGVKCLTAWARDNVAFAVMLGDQGLRLVAAPQTNAAALLDGLFRYDLWHPLADFCVERDPGWKEAFADYHRAQEQISAKLGPPEFSGQRLIEEIRTDPRFINGLKIYNGGGISWVGAWYRDRHPVQVSLWLANNTIIILSLSATKDEKRMLLWLTAAAQDGHSRN